MSYHHNGRKGQQHRQPHRSRGPPPPPPPAAHQALTHHPQSTQAAYHPAPPTPYSPPQYPPQYTHQPYPPQHGYQPPPPPPQSPYQQHHPYPQHQPYQHAPYQPPPAYHAPQPPYPPQTAYGQDPYAHQPWAPNPTVSTGPPPIPPTALPTPPAPSSTPAESLSPEDNDAFEAFLLAVDDAVQTGTLSHVKRLLMETQGWRLETKGWRLDGEAAKVLNDVNARLDRRRYALIKAGQSGSMATGPAQAHAGQPSHTSPAQSTPDPPPIKREHESPGSNESRFPPVASDPIVHTPLYTGASKPASGAAPTRSSLANRPPPLIAPPCGKTNDPFPFRKFRVTKDIKAMTLYKPKPDGKPDDYRLSPARYKCTKDEDQHLCYPVYWQGTKCPYGNTPGACRNNHNLRQDVLTWLIANRELSVITANKMVNSFYESQPVDTAEENRLALYKPAPLQSPEQGPPPPPPQLDINQYHPQQQGPPPPPPQLNVIPHHQRKRSPPSPPPQYHPQKRIQPSSALPDLPQNRGPPSPAQCHSQNPSTGSIRRDEQAADAQTKSETETGAVCAEPSSGDSAAGDIT